MTQQQERWKELREQYFYGALASIKDNKQSRALLLFQSEPTVQEAFKGLSE